MTISGSYQTFSHVSGPEGQGSWFLKSTTPGGTLHMELLLTPQSSKPTGIPFTLLGPESSADQDSANVFGLTGMDAGNTIVREDALSLVNTNLSVRKTYQCTWPGCERKKPYTKKGHYENHIEKHHTSLARQQYYGSHIGAFANAGLGGANDVSGVLNATNT